MSMIFRSVRIRRGCLTLQYKRHGAFFAASLRKGQLYYQ